MNVSKAIINLTWVLFLACFFVLMAQIILHYIPYSSNAAFLQIKQTEVLNTKVYLPIFYVHVYSSLFVLLAGFSQFNGWLLRYYPKIHKLGGYIYVVTVLGFTAPSGFFMAWFANGGALAKLSFIILAILWFYFTLKATLCILNGNVVAHKNFMIRSFALTTSAFTLRLWKLILIHLFHLAPMDAYQIVAWLSWIPNLFIAEWLIKKNKIS